jgi:hypothetical protein
MDRSFPPNPVTVHVHSLTAWLIAAVVTETLACTVVPGGRCFVTQRFNDSGHQADRLADVA